MALRAALGKWRERLRSSLWLVPGCCTLAALGAAKGLAILDAKLQRQSGAWFLFAGEPSSARDVVSTIASSMLTFTALVFSITILALQAASNQFSPRVLRTFLTDRVTHVAMGAFVGTFVYAMSLLPEIRDDHDGRNGFVPALSVYIAFTLVLVSVGIFIHYIHHMAHSLRATTVIRRIGRETRKSLLSRYSEPLEAEERAQEAPGDREEAEAWSTHEPRIVPQRSPGGVLVSLQESELMKLAERHDAFIEVVPMLGDFVPQGATLFRVWSAEDEPDAEALREALSTSEERNPDDDPAFGLRQLVDIANRALSPGINDPSTAVQVLDQLHESLRLLSGRCIPPPLKRGHDGAARLLVPAASYETFVHLALDEIRRAGCGSLPVVRRLRALLQDCLSVAHPDRHACLLEQLRLLDESSRSKFGTLGDRVRSHLPSPQGQGNASNEAGAGSRPHAQSS